MDLNLRGKKAFISGSTSGIGFATAKALLQEGASVIVNGREGNSVDAAVAKLSELVHGAIVEGRTADLSSAQETQTLLGGLSDVDILINNVGIFKSQSFFESTDEDWFRQHEVNVMSGVRLSRHFLPGMLKSNWGRILFISSECASLVPPDLIAYSSSKAAILAVSRGLAQLTSGTGVTVNAIIPGSTMTEGAERFLDDVAGDENKTRDQVEGDFFDKVRTSSLLKRFATVEEIASTITYYSSPLSSATNGATIKIDGGSMGGII